MQPFSGTPCPARRTQRCDFPRGDGNRWLLAAALPALSPLRDRRSYG
jgi:hypothetical protein